MTHQELIARFRLIKGLYSDPLWVEYREIVGTSVPQDALYNKTYEKKNLEVTN